MLLREVILRLCLPNRVVIHIRASHYNSPPLPLAAETYAADSHLGWERIRFYVNDKRAKSKTHPSKDADR
ncbi:hypothetical protein CLV84_1277 [Neolewinella xylanilytica]|uniref:Uncharacterized protein n=1 Tax=Neolewinella xylanilytica TaxID=1514080 RepID=A0A2S6IA05_9BACT|nr:hypothetical protein CLV84_1277 [Neolewinella xylanilytica]